MDELESAVLLCLDPTAEKSLRDRALQYCQNIRQSPEGWAFVLQRISVSVRPEVAFWCIQVIHETLSNAERYPGTFSADQAAAVRGKVLEFFSGVVYPGTSENGAEGTERRMFPNFLLNKTAQLVASLIAADYPHRWPGAFQETILPLVGGNQVTEATISMFFRLLRTLDDDVTSIRATQVGEPARKISMRVKDAMRDDCIPEIVAKCIDKLASPKHVSLAFDFFSRFVEWVDIGLIAQEKILRPMYAAITSTAWSNARPAAAAALRSIVTKRMDLISKVNLMKVLRVEELLQSIPVNEVIAHENEEADSELNLHTGQVEVAALVNTTAVAALDVLKDSLKGNKQLQPNLQISSDAGRIAQTALPVALRFLHENADEETSSQTLQCVTTYVNVFSRVTKTNNNGISGDGFAAMAAILTVVEERSIFANDFDPQDEESDGQREFLELRRVLLKNVFTSVVRSFPDLCLDFVKNLLTKASESGDLPKTELGMAMLLILNGTCPDTPSIMQLRRDVIVNPPACMSFTADLSTSSLNKLQLAQKHQLELISSTYFDLVARSYRMFLTRVDPALLSAVLPVFFDGRGLAHASSELVRSHAAYSLLKLTRPLRSIVTNNHLEAILNAVQTLLFPLDFDVNSQNSKNQMMIFETVGYLLGTDHKKGTSLQYLKAILKPIVEELHANLGAEAVPYITASGFLSKGFGGDSKPLLLLNEASRSDQSLDSDGNVMANEESSGKEVKVQKIMPLTGDMQMIWVSCLEAVLKASTPGFELGNDVSLSELRSKTLFFLHRMIDTVGSPVLPYLEGVLPKFLTSSASSPMQLRDVVILVSQAITKFGEGCEKMVMCVYAPIVRHVHGHSYTLDPKTLMAVSEESREAVEMLRAYTYFLHAVVGTKLIGVLIHPNHAGLMQGVMASLLSSAVGDSLDIRVASSVMKMCLHMLGLMVEKWTSGNEASGRQGPPGFREFALKEISSASVMSGVRGTVFRIGDYNGGQAVAVLTEIVTLQRTCALHLGREFGETLQNGVWNRLPKENVHTYLSALYSADTATGTLVPALATLCRVLRSS